MADADAFLESPSLRRVLIALSILSIAIVVILRFFVFPEYGVKRFDSGPYGVLWIDIVSYLLHALLNALLPAFLILLLILWFDPFGIKRPTIDPLRPADINAALKASVAQTNEYFFRGRTGRWFRAYVLPSVSRQAAQARSRRHLVAILPNPLNEKILQVYAAQRNAVARSREPRWSAELFQEEIVATISAIIESYSQNHYLEATIGLIDVLPVTRADMSSKAVIITTDNPTEPGLRIDGTSPFYVHWKAEFEALLDVSERKFDDINLPQANRREVIRRVIQVLDLPAENFDDARIDRIASLIDSESDWET
jgi:hypothetical protein